MTADIAHLARNARIASRSLAATSAEERNAALHAIAIALENEKDTLLAANQKDMLAAQEMVKTGEISSIPSARGEPEEPT